MTRSVRLAHETFGDEEDECVLLIAGLGAQMLAWPDDFCRRLADLGLWVVRLDNRDSGLSPVSPDSLYSLADMAGDVARLILDLGRTSAHLVGQSLGGLIAMQVAVDYPERVLSLSLISTTPAISYFLSEGVQALVGAGAPEDRTQAINQHVALTTSLASSAHPIDAQEEARIAGLMWDRGWNTEGKTRQMAAIFRMDDLTHRLGEVRVPTTVIHGRADPLIAPQAATAIAEAIEGSELHLLPGMGHVIPASLWETLATLIAAGARRRLPV